jgi:branched-chain amino acid transport system ATP-binding protein
MGEPVLHVEALEAGYNEVQVLWGVSLAVPRGAMTTLVGTNGAGKTTSLRAITGNLRPFGGRVMFAGEDVTRMAPHAKAARGLVLVPEGRQLYGTMSVQENWAPSPRAGDVGYQIGSRRCTRCFRDSRNAVAKRPEPFPAVSSRCWRLPAESCPNPEVLVIDELSLGLAPVVVQQLAGTLRALKQSGMTILLVEQNVRLALALSDYAYVIAEGRPFTEGSCAELAQKSEIRQAYLGL